MGKKITNEDINRSFSNLSKWCAPEAKVQFKKDEKYCLEDPKCEKCGSSLDFCSEEFEKSWFQCKKCGNIENVKEW